METTVHLCEPISCEFYKINFLENLIICQFLFFYFFYYHIQYYLMNDSSLWWWCDGLVVSVPDWIYKNCRFAPTASRVFLIIRAQKKLTSSEEQTNNLLILHWNDLEKHLGYLSKTLNKSCNFHHYNVEIRKKQKKSRWVCDIS